MFTERENTMEFEQRIESLCYGAQPTAREAVKLGRAFELPNKIKKVATFTNNFGEVSDISFIPHHYASAYPRLEQHDGGGDISSGIVALPQRFNWIYLVIMLQEYKDNEETKQTNEIDSVVYADWWIVGNRLELPQEQDGAKWVKYFGSWAHSSIWLMRPSGLGVFLACLYRF